MNKRSPLLGTATLALGLALTLALGPARAQGTATPFPEKPMTLVVPFAAGGPADVLARLLGQHLGLGQQVLIDNKAGAGGTLGAGAVARAAPDGHTLLFVTAGHAGSKALYPKLGFDPVASFEPVYGLSASAVAIVVRADSRLRSINDLVTAARARPGELNCAGGGGGATVTNLAFELVKAELKLQITAVPYQGSAPAITALLGGQIDCNSDAIAAVVPQVAGGKLRALAVTTRSRSSLLPDVPTLHETVLPGMDASAWYGILAPKGTPRAVLDKLEAAFATAMRKPEVRARFQASGAEPIDMPAREFGALIASETQRWGDLITRLGLAGH